MYANEMTTSRRHERSIFYCVFSPSVQVTQAL